MQNLLRNIKRQQKLCLKKGCSNRRKYTRLKNEVMLDLNLNFGIFSRLFSRDAEV